MTVGISFTGTSVESMVEDVEYKHFKTTQPVEIPLGETAGNEVSTTAEYFVVASLDMANDDEVAVAMGAPEYLDESTVFISNEEGEVGAGLFVIEEGDMDDAIDRFEEKYLGDSHRSESTRGGEDDTL